VFSFEEIQENYSLKRMIEASSNSHHQIKKIKLSLQKVKGQKQSKYLKFDQ
jgi:hypothetical protein